MRLLAHYGSMVCFLFNNLNVNKWHVKEHMRTTQNQSDIALAIMLQQQGVLTFDNK